VTARERKLLLFVMGCAANATRCGACQMINDSASRILAEVRAELSYDEMVEVCLAPQRSENCSDKI
jgi:hypothetical protein